jgi:hypothetical protein
MFLSARCDGAQRGERTGVHPRVKPEGMLRRNMRYGTKSSFSLNIGRARRLPSAFCRKRTPISSPLT